MNNNSYDKKVHLKEFLNTPGELHALVLGWAEVVVPWPPRHKAMCKATHKELLCERHYYQLGRSLGIFTWYGMIVGILFHFF